jgi:hypothetical protein
MDVFLETDTLLPTRLRRSTWGKGYVTEGSRALIANGCADWGVKRAFAFTMLVNAASCIAIGRSRRGRRAGRDRVRTHPIGVGRECAAEGLAALVGREGGFEPRQGRQDERR